MTRIQPNMEVTMFVNVKHVSTLHPVFILEGTPVRALLIYDVLFRVDVVQVPLEVVTFEVFPDSVAIPQVTNVSFLNNNISTMIVITTTTRTVLAIISAL